jgi:hypothetical protein
MRILIKSNFFVPGVDDSESIELNRKEMTLRELLETLSKLSPAPIEYVKPGSHALDPDDWEVDINGVPYQDLKARLETPLKDGDTVAIRILAMGGG